MQFVFRNAKLMIADDYFSFFFRLILSSMGSKPRENHFIDMQFQIPFGKDYGNTVFQTALPYNSF